MSTSYGQALRAAVIGYGLAGSVFHAPLIASTPGMEVSAIVTGNQERQQRAHQHYPGAAILAQAEELWRDAQRYDLVVVATQRVPFRRGGNVSSHSFDPSVTR